MSLSPHPWYSSPNRNQRGNVERRMEDLLNVLETALVPGSYTAATEHAPAGLASYGRALKRHKFALLFSAITFAFLGWFYAHSQPKVYRAHTMIELLEPNRSLMNIQNFNSNNSAISEELYIDTQVSLLESKSLLDRVRRRLEASGAIQPIPAASNGQSASDPTEKSAVNAKNLNVSPVRATRLVELTYDANDPKLAALILNTITAEYIQQDVDARVDNSEQMQQWLQTQLAETKAKLEASEFNLQNYARSSGLLFTSPKGNVAEQTEDKLQFIAQDLSQSQAKVADLQAKYEIAKAKEPGSQIDDADSGPVRDLELRLSDLKRQRASLNSVFTPEYYKVQELDAEIQEVQANLQKEYARWVRRMGDAYTTEVRHEKLLEESYNQQRSLVSDQAGKAIHYNVLKREVETNQNLYDALLAGMKGAGVNAAARVHNARVIDAADLPRRPDHPKPLQDAAIGLISGLMLAGIFAMIREGSDRRVKSPGVVPSYLNLPELGVIPSAKPYLLPTAYNESRRHRGGERNPAFSPVLEAFHSVVTSILSASRSAEPPKVVVLTSAAAHEGKSTVIGNIAVIAAQIGRRVLLIDGDMRNPRQHHVYGVPNTPGLSDVLGAGDLATDDIVAELIRPTSVPGLSLLPSGTKADQVGMLLHSPRLEELIAQFRDDFDLVLIDTPPVLPFADARVFGRFADAVVLVVRSGRTTRHLVQAARARFVEDGVPVFGTILNDWNGKQAPYEASDYAYPS